MLGVGSRVRINYTMGVHPDILKNRSINQPAWLDHKTMKSTCQEYGLTPKDDIIVTNWII